MSEYAGVPALVNYQQAEGWSSLDLTAPPRDRLVWQFARYLMQKAISVFEWKMPELWSKNYVLYCLYCFGRVAVVNTDRFGTIAQACGLMGYNVYYQPTQAIITNALLRGNLTPRIGTECTILRLQPDYGGILDLVSMYANLLAECAMAAGINLVNSKTAYGFATDRKSIAEAIKKAYDQVANGQPLVVVDKALAADPEAGFTGIDRFFRDVRSGYILSDLLADMRKIEAMYDTDIGIPNANTDKRERLISDEVNANNVETYSKCALWLEELQDACRKTREMFGIELSVDWRKLPDIVPDIAGGDSDAVQS